MTEYELSNPRTNSCQGIVVKSGLVSVSFRNLAPKNIIDLCIDCGLKCIEWGADVHVPPTDSSHARQVSLMTREAGLSVAAYGSYYFLNSDSQTHYFEEILETATILEAPVIRIWAGKKPSAESTEQDWHVAIEDSRRIADLAANEGIKIAYEYHRGTLTDTNESALKLLKAVDHSNIYSFWQPPDGRDADYCMAGLQGIIDAGKLSSMHVFHWWPSYRERHILESGIERWRNYLRLANQAPGDRCACLEFSKDDDPDNTRRDAATLAQLIREVTVQ